MSQVLTYRLKAILSHFNERFYLSLINTNTQDELNEIWVILNTDKTIKDSPVALEDDKLWDCVPVEIEWNITDVASSTGDQEFADNLCPTITIQNRFIQGIDALKNKALKSIGEVHCVVVILNLNLPTIGRTEFVLYAKKNADSLGVMTLDEIENIPTIFASQN